MALKSSLEKQAKADLEKEFKKGVVDHAQFTGKAARTPLQMVTDYLQIDEFNSILWHVLRGQLTLTLSFVLVQLFSEKANFELPTVGGVNLKNAAAEAAYGVY